MELKSIVDFISKSTSTKIDGGLLICTYSDSDKVWVEEFKDTNLINYTNVEDDQDTGEFIIEFDLPSLFSYGFIPTISLFFKTFRYTPPNKNIYIFNPGFYYDDDKSLKKKMSLIHDLISAIIKASRFHYIQANIENILLISAGESLLLPVDYKYKDLSNLKDKDLEKLSAFVELLQHSTLDGKKEAFLSNLIHFLQPISDVEKFSYLLQNFSSYYEQSVASYNFYLRDFNFSKFKLEIENKALDFTQKIQAVINDSQTKLIIIPTAAALVFANLDYSNINVFKNYAALFALIILCIFLQIFIFNQYSALKFINKNISNYKLTFKKTEQEAIKSVFKDVEDERKKQIKRLKIMQLLLWLMPIATITIMLYFNLEKLLATIFFVIAIAFAMFVFFKKSI